MKKFVQFPDGTWVNPGCVMIVKARQSDTNENAQVIMYISEIGEYNLMIYSCKSYADAIELRDEIAEILNQDTLEGDCNEKSYTKVETSKENVMQALRDMTINDKDFDCRPWTIWDAVVMESAARMIRDGYRDLDTKGKSTN